MENTAIWSWSDKLIAGGAGFRRVSRGNVVGRVVGEWLRDGATWRDESFGEYDVETRRVLGRRGRCPGAILFAAAGALAMSAGRMNAGLRGEWTESMM